MASREDLPDWVVAALRAHGGKGSIYDVCKYIWTHYEADLRGSEKLLYTWQYEVRWAAHKLRKDRIMKAVHGDKSRPWELA